MAPQPGAVVHFHAAFEIHAVPGCKLEWLDVVRQIRKWVGKRANEPQALGGRWFFHGGGWKSREQVRTTVNVAAEYSSDSKAPLAWALEFQHACSDVPYRQWATEIGLLRVDGDVFRFALRTSYWLLREYVGPEPEAPKASSPQLIRAVLTEKNIHARSGSQELSAAPVVLTAGSGKEFTGTLEDAKRDTPIVYVSLPFPDRDPLLDPATLANALAGAAGVYVAESSELDKELEFLLPRPFRCWNGMARIYFPRAQLASKWDHKRHRFFTARDLAEREKKEVVDMLVRAIARRQDGRAVGYIVSLADVEKVRQDRRAEELRAQIRSNRAPEDYPALSADLEQLFSYNDQLKSERDKYQTQCELLNATIEDATTAKDYWENEAAERNKRISELDRASTKFARLSKLPSSTLECVETIADLYPTRIVFTESARQSAKRNQARIA